MEPITLRNKEMDEAKQIARRNQIFSTLFLLALIVFIPLFMADGSGENLLLWENRTLTITTPDEQVYHIPYDRITGMELIESPDFGTCLSGDSTRTLRYGVWKNELLGEYVLCAYRSFDVVIQINTPDQIYWIGYESEETTRILYQSFLEHLNQ